MRSILALFLIVQAGAASAGTDFGVRQAPSTLPADSSAGAGFTPLKRAASGTADLRGAALIGAQWGRVTSTVRSPEHNRRVGGVRNSFHLSGRAIDIARRPGVRHADIAAALRAAGYVLVESLDEGDHSHFAFGTGAAPVYRSFQPPQRSASTQWRVVTVASAILK